MSIEAVKLAREAGCIPVRHPEYDNDVQVFATPDELERFAALIAAAEREACAKACEDDKTQAMEWLAHSRPGGHFAAAIRARGQA
jgi:hypothetical protein